MTAAYVGPPLATLAGLGLWLGRGGRPPDALVGGLVLAGMAVGTVLGWTVAASERRIVDDLDHDLRGPVTIIRGEVELVLSRGDLAPAERARSAGAVIAEAERLERILRDAT